jgi:hypothetical protein
MHERRVRVTKRLKNEIAGLQKRQRTAALQDLSESPALSISRERLGVRLSSAAFNSPLPKPRPSPLVRMTSGY